MKVQPPPLPTADFAAAHAVSGGKPAAAPASGNAPAQASPPQAEAAAQPKQPSPQELERAVAELQRKVQASARNLQFSIDSSSGRMVVKVTDANTHELIMQIPSDAILNLDRALDRMQGLLLHKKA